VLELVTVGDLTDHRKGVDVVIKALAAHPEIACRLTIVGGGAALGKLKELAGNDARLRFLGHLPPNRTQAVLAQSDVFLFPTRSEVFGLALVEAMGVGLCVIASTAAGAVEDVCVDGRNCLLVATHDPNRWGAAIARVAEDSRLRRRLGERARWTIRSRWTIDHAAEAMIAGLALAASSKGKP
jgi:glycosyltransferase involved in cell wall biosynthesis